MWWNRVRAVRYDETDWLAARKEDLPDVITDEDVRVEA